MEWISAEDRKPAEDKTVLVALSNKDVTMGSRWDSPPVEGWYLDGDGYVGFIPDDTGTTRITHWQPLPEPPEVG